MENWRDTIISQYATSPTLVQLIADFNAWVDPKPLIDSFYEHIWNVDTASGYGLDVWGRIVGVGRVLEVAQGKYFGFAEATVISADPFNCSPFFNGETLTNAVILDDPGFRTLILAKAAANICDGSIPAINRILMMLFAGRGNVYVTDNNDMTMNWSFTFQPTPLEASIVAQSGVLPKPAGVTASMALVVNVNESPSGTHLDQADLIDVGGEEWGMVASPFSGNLVTQNGVPDLSTSFARQLLWFDGALYYENTGGQWFQLVGPWVSITGDPRGGALLIDLQRPLTSALGALLSS